MNSQPNFNLQIWEVTADIAWVRHWVQGTQVASTSWCQCWGRGGRHNDAGWPKGRGWGRWECSKSDCATDWVTVCRTFCSPLYRSMQSAVTSKAVWSQFGWQSHILFMAYLGTALRMMCFSERHSICCAGWAWKTDRRAARLQFCWWVWWVIA